MNSVNPVRISHDKSGHLQIDSDVFHTHVKVDAEWATLLSSAKHWLEEKLGSQKFVKLQVGDRKVFVKVQDICRQLEISEGAFKNAYSDSNASVARLLANIQCEKTFRKLDDYYSKNALKDVKELRSVKEIVRLSILSMALYSNANSKDLYREMPIGKQRVVIIDSPDALRIRGLFGEELGRGGCGVAIQAVDLLEGQTAAGKDAVLKLPLAASGEAEIVREAAILKKINPRSTILGLQKPLKTVKAISQGLPIQGHLGARYDSDLHSVLYPDQHTYADKLSITYQLFHGLAHMHEHDVTHGDIKSTNVFYEKTKDPVVGPLVYLADFGGSIDHNDPNRVAFALNTPPYRTEEDATASMLAHNSGDFETELEVEKMADVFGLCAVLTWLLGAAYTYSPDFPFAGFDAFNYPTGIAPDLKNALIAGGLSERTAELFNRGMDLDYRKRPEAKAILHALRSDLAKADPTRAQTLQALSATV